VNTEAATNHGEVVPSSCGTLRRLTLLKRGCTVNSSDFESIEGGWEFLQRLTRSWKKNSVVCIV